MKSYLVDSNFFLRYVLKDNLVMWKKSDNYFRKAKKGSIHLIFLSEVVLEIEYVLRKLYSLPRIEIQSNLLKLINASYIEIRNKEMLRLAFNYYIERSIDLVDLLLYFSSKNENIEILSFDKDYKKLANIDKN